MYVNPVLPPAAPANECMLRCSLMADHTYELIDEACDIIKAMIDKVAEDKAAGKFDDIIL